MVKAGYKQTEIGLIPEDWGIVSLLEKADLINGLTYSPDNIQDYGLLVMRSSNVQNGRFSFADNVYVDCAVLKEHLIKKNDILICVRNGSAALIGKCAKADKDYNATFGAFMAVLRGINNAYIFQILQQGTIQKQISKNSDSTINQITNSDFKQIKIPFPQEELERLHITTALSDMDNLIANLEKLIEKKKAIKQGAMQELLMGKRRINGFTGEWKIQSIGTYGKFIGGTCFPLVHQGKQSEKYPFYKVSDFNNIGNERCLNRANNYVSSKTAQLLGCSIIPPNAIVVAKIGAAIFLERKKLTTVECCIDNNMMAFVPKETVSAEFIWYIFQSTKFGDLTEATALPSLNGKTVCAVERLFPSSIEEQIEIAHILSDMDSEIEELERKLVKYKAIKRGMMSELLTGRIRLVDKEEA